MLLLQEGKYSFYKDGGYSLIETIVCLPFFLFGLLTLYSELTFLSKELTVEAIAAKNLSNLTWRIARSIEEDVNSAPIPVATVLRVLSPETFSYGAFLPEPNSSIIASIRLDLFSSKDKKSSSHFLGITADYLCEYDESLSAPLESIIFDTHCESPTHYIPITHVHIYFVDTSHTLRLMSLKGTEVLENQPVYSNIKSIQLNKDGVQIKNLFGSNAFAPMVPRVSQLPPSELINTLSFISHTEERSQ